MRLKVIPKKKLKTLIQKSLEASKKAYVTDPDRYNSYNANPKNKSEAAKKAYKQKTVKKPLNTITVSTEKKYVVRKWENIHCVNPIKAVLNFMLKAFFVNLCVIQN